MMTFFSAASAIVIVIAELAAWRARRSFARTMTELSERDAARTREYVATIGRNTETMQAIARGLALPSHRAKDARAS